MDINLLLQKARTSGASDVHIAVGLPPMMRLNGEVTPINRGDAPLTDEDTKRILFDIIPNDLKNVLNIEGEVDFAHSLEGYGRFRCNVFRQRNVYSGALRLLNDKIATFEELGLPRVIKKFATLKKGLVLVTGPTGCGKSTTLATIIDQINKTRNAHVITLEDPIEYVHNHNKSIINQREIGADTSSFAHGLRSALREDPDVILVGEMRDLETISATLTAAETGHLVFSTVHTIGAATTINRIIDAFEPHQQQQVRTQLASVLEGVITQRLLLNSTNSGRIAAFEIMFGTDAVHNMIRENKCYQIPTVLQTNTAMGMQSLDAHLARLVQEGRITRETAFANCFDHDSLEKILKLM